MNQKFDWRSEEEAGWAEYAEPQIAAPSAKTKGRRWFRLLLICLVLVSASFLAFRQLSTYLVETNDEVELNIRSSQELVLKAAREADPELLANTISGREPEWAQAYLLLLQQGLMFDRHPFGLTLADGGRSAAFQVETTPNLNQAEVTTVMTYTIELGQDQLEAVALSYSSVYRRSEERWLLSPPTGDYWGDILMAEGHYLTLWYPERDAAFGQRLAVDLEEVLASACSILEDLACGQNFHLFVRLSADPGTLTMMAEPYSRLNPGPELELPAPTIFGIPEHEGGYIALYRAYAERVVAAAVAQQTGWICCEHIIFYRALLDHQLEQLGLRPRSSVPEHYQQAINLEYEDMENLWLQHSLPPGEDALDQGLLAYVMIDYLLNGWGVGSAATIQRSLLANQDFGQWLESFGGPTALDSIAGDWQSFLIEKVNALGGLTPRSG